MSDGSVSVPAGQPGADASRANILLFRKPGPGPSLPAELPLTLGLATEPLDEMRSLVESVLLSDMPTQEKIDHVIAVGRCATELLAAIVVYLERIAAAEEVAARG